jgi:transposase InsO family protein
VLDSGCTNHMTGEKDMFHSLQLTQEAQEIVFGDSDKSEVIGVGNIPISDHQSLSNVLLVDSLSYNLMSVSQLCGMGYNRLFTDVDVKILRREDSSVAFTGRLKGKLYLVDFITSRVTHETCLVAKSDKGWLWHRRLAHVGMRNLAKLQKDNHIIGLTNVMFEKNKVCSACQAGKQHGVPHQSKNVVTTTKRPLELLHMDLFRLMAYISIGGSKYGLVIIDDFSRFTWVFFLSDKGETQETLKKFMRRSQNEFELKIKKVRSDNGTEFKNTGVEEFLGEEGIKHEFSVPYTPQQNGVVERKNRTLIEAARTMLDEYKIFGQRRLTPPVMQSTAFIFTRFTRRHPTSFSPVINLRLITLEFLGVNATFLTRKSRAQSLLLEWTRASCLVMHQMCMDIVFSTIPPVLLK